MEKQQKSTPNDFRASQQQLINLESQSHFNEIEQDNKQNFSNLQKGPLKQEQRQCKDLFCFFFYWINTGLMIGLSTWAYFTGQPKNIYRATDSYGNVCGQQKSAVQNYRYSYFYNPTNYALTNRVCVKACPTYDFQGLLLSQIQCYPSGPPCNVNVTVFWQGYTNQTIQDYGNYFIGYESRQKIDRICLPEPYVFEYAFWKYSTDFSNQLMQSQMLDFISDVQNNYLLLVVMAGLAILAAWVYWFAFRYAPDIMIYISFIVTIALFLAIGIVFLYSGGGLSVGKYQGRLRIPTTVDQQFYIIYGGFTLAFAIIAFICFLFCCFQMYPFLELLKVVRKFVKDVPSSMVIVVQMTVMMTIFWVTSVSSMTYALSASSYKYEGKVFTQVVSKVDKGIIFFYYFIINSLWTHQIFIATMTFGMSMMFSTWYFSRTEQDLKKLLFRTLNMIMRYHYGSLVFGSFVLLIVQFIQFFNEMFFFINQWKYKNSNPCFRCVDKVTNAIYQFLSKITSRFNRYAYIQIALRGKSYMQASKDGYFLLHYNKNSFGVQFGLNSMTSFIFRLGISLIPTTVFYYLTNFWTQVETNILQPIYYTIIIFYYSLGISTVIFGSYRAMIDTLLSCYVIDQMIQKQKQLKPKCAPDNLQRLFQIIS